jgi:hypothetical protein
VPQENVFSDARLAPAVMSAGDSAEFVVRLTVGPGYTSGPSRIIFDLPGELGVSRPSCMFQEEDGYVDAYVGNPLVEYNLRVWDMGIGDFPTRDKRSWLGRAARMAVLDLAAGLREGDVIEFHWGESGRGFGPGAKVTIVVPRPGYESTIHVRYFEGTDRGLPDFGRSFEGYERPEPECEVALPYRVIPRAPHHLRLIRKRDRAMLLVHDRFWNVSEVGSPDEVAQADGEAAANDFGVFEFPDPHVAVHSKGLPLLDAPSMEDVYDGYNLYWGDVHTHSAFSVDCIEREKMQMGPGDLMAFARRCAGLDFFAVTDHHEPQRAARHRIGADRWARTMEALQEHDRPGEFLVFPGFEYRCRRGDTAVLCGWLPDYEEIDGRDWRDLRRLWEAWAGRDFLTIPHFHNPGELDEGEWWENVESGAEPVLEIFSCHGSYERPDALEQKIPMIKPRRPDRYGSSLLQRGLRYGLVCNSDGHKGHVGLNGLTAVFAKSLDKDSIFDAYRARRVYGTTNARIRLVFTGNGHLMGSIVPNASHKEFTIDAAGENALKKVDVFRNGEPYKRLLPEGRTFKTDLKVTDDDKSFWYVRVTQVDNQIAYSSPIWFD